MAELSPGERAWLRVRPVISNAGSRPQLILGAVVILGAMTAMAASITNASRFPDPFFAPWVLSAALGFGLDVQIALLIGALMLVVDRMTGGSGAVARVLMAVVVVLAGLGVVANVLATVEAIRIYAFGIPGATQAEGWAVVISAHLVPTVVALVAGWLAWAAGRSGGLVP